MDSLMSLANTLAAMIIHAFSLMIQLILSVLSIFVVLFQGIARALGLN